MEKRNVRILVIATVVALLTLSVKDQLKASQICHPLFNIDGTQGLKSTFKDPLSAKEPFERIENSKIDRMLVNKEGESQISHIWATGESNLYFAISRSTSKNSNNKIFDQLHVISHYDKQTAQVANFYLGTFQRLLENKNGTFYILHTKDDKQLLTRIDHYNHESNVHSMDMGSRFEGHYNLESMTLGDKDKYRLSPYSNLRLIDQNHLEIITDSFQTALEFTKAVTLIRAAQKMNLLTRRPTHLIIDLDFGNVTAEFLLQNKFGESPKLRKINNKYYFTIPKEYPAYLGEHKSLQVPNLVIEKKHTYIGEPIKIGNESFNLDTQIKIPMSSDELK